MLLAHSAGGGSTFRVPDLNAKNVVGIVGVRGRGQQSGRGRLQQFAAVDHHLEDRAGAAAGFTPVDRGGCAMQGDAPSKLVNFAELPIILVGSEKGLNSGKDALKCQASVWQQAGVDASYVYLPDRGLKGGGHFAMAQLDTAKYAKVFIDLATEVERKAKK